MKQAHQQLLMVKEMDTSVGMSQYSAQKMASVGKDYREILDFYYPTTTLLSFYTTKYPRKEQEQEQPERYGCA